MGATVKMTEIDKQQVRTVSTDATGRFAMPNLPVGAYRLEVTSSGFKAYIQTGIVLQVASNIDIPVTLQIGSVTESIAGDGERRDGGDQGEFDLPGDRPAAH